MALFRDEISERDKKQAAERREQEYRRARDKPGFQKQIDNLCRTMDPEVVGLKERYRQSFADAHSEDANGYSFEAQRHGDFLLLMLTRLQIARDPHPSCNQPEPPIRVEKVAYTANLGKTDNISFHAGTPAEDSWTVTFYLMNIWNAGSEYFDKKSRILLPKDNFYYHEQRLLDVQPAYPSLSPRKPYMEGVEKPNEYNLVPRRYQSNFGCSPSSYVELDGVPTFEIPRFPFPALDDVIYFSGIRSALYVPHGLGPEVHEKILKAIATGA